MSEREADMKELAKAFFQHLQRSNCEYGAIGVDCKRPFGSSSVAWTILDLIGAERCDDGGYSDEQLEYADGLYDDLIEWLQKKSKRWLK